MEREDDSNKSNSNSDDDDYSVSDDPEKNTDSDNNIIGDKDSNHEGMPGNEFDYSNDPDFDRLRKITHMERLYNDILSNHHGHNKGESLKWQCGEKFANISKTWTILFCKTCPGCIQSAPKSKPIAGLHNIITLGLGVRGQIDLINFQSMPELSALPSHFIKSSA